MIVFNEPQGSPEWFASRAGMATASCFAEILAKARGGYGESASRRNLRTRLVLERLTGRRAPSFESGAIRLGIEREPLARMAFEIETGYSVSEVGFCRHDILEAGCSPDGLIGTDGGLEIKSPQPSAHLEALRTREVPSEYVAQVQGGMWICNRKWWRFVSFNPDFPETLQLVTVNAPRDQKYIDNLAAQVSVFMQEVKQEEAELASLSTR